MSDTSIPGIFFNPEIATDDENADLYKMGADKLRSALITERNKVRQLNDDISQLKVDQDKQRQQMQEEYRQQQSEKRRARAEASEYKRATIIVNKKQWEIVRRYCYTHNINQSDFVGQALDMYLQTLNTTRLKKLPPDGIHKGGRPRGDS